VSLQAARTRRRCSVACMPLHCTTRHLSPACLPQLQRVLLALEPHQHCCWSWQPPEQDTQQAVLDTRGMGGASTELGSRSGPCKTPIPPPPAPPTFLRLPGRPVACRLILPLFLAAGPFFTSSSKPRPESTVRHCTWPGGRRAKKGRLWGKQASREAGLDADGAAAVLRGRHLQQQTMQQIQATVSWVGSTHRPCSPFHRWPHNLGHVC
jgi:hypothetical protein